MCKSFYLKKKKKLFSRQFGYMWRFSVYRVRAFIFTKRKLLIIDLIKIISFGYIGGGGAGVLISGVDILILSVRSECHAHTMHLFIVSVMNLMKASVYD